MQTGLILRVVDTSSRTSSMGKKPNQGKLLLRIAMHWFRLENSRSEIQILYSALSFLVRPSCSLRYVYLVYQEGRVVCFECLRIRLSLR